MSKQFTALVHRICPCCGEKDDEQSEILIHRKFGDLSKVHNKAIGFGNFCKSCKELTDKAVVCVVIDQSKSSDLSNPFRTGNIFGLSSDWCERALPNAMYTNVMKKRMFYMDYRDALQIGLSVKYTP